MSWFPHCQFATSCSLFTSACWVCDCPSLLVVEICVEVCVCVRVCIPINLVVQSVEQLARSIDTHATAWLRKDTINWASSVDESLNRILYNLTCIVMNRTSMNHNSLIACRVHIRIQACFTLIWLLQEACNCNIYNDYSMNVHT